MRELSVSQENLLNVADALGEHYKYLDFSYKTFYTFMYFLIHQKAFTFLSMYRAYPGLRLRSCGNCGCGTKFRGPSKKSLPDSCGYCAAAAAASASAAADENSIRRPGYVFLKEIFSQNIFL